MIAQDRHFRLRPYVFLVKGAARAALYDLHRHRIFPVPSSAAYVLERCDEHPVDEVLGGIEDPENREMALEYLEELQDMDFGRYHTAGELRTLMPFNYVLPDHKARQLLWLSLDLREENSAPEPFVDWADLMQVARKGHKCRQLTVFLSGKQSEEAAEVAIVEAAARLRFHHLELVIPAAGVGAALESASRDLNLRLALDALPDPAHPIFQRLQAAKLKVRFSPIAAPTPITASVMVCDHEAFRRLKNVSVHCNSLYINRRGEVYPWAMEKHHLIGHVRDGGSLDQLMASEALKMAWSFTKDSVEQCKDCEFRYGCPQSYSFRKEADRIGSEPANCTYDPYEGKWLHDEEPNLFDEDQLEERLHRASAYFDVYSCSERPIPEAYPALLDRAVSTAMECLGLPKPKARLKYCFYPNLDLLTREIQRRHGLHVSGLTEVTGQGETVIRSSYPGHVHEVLHALLLAVNPEPRFFVSEACATLLGTCWGAAEDLLRPDDAFSHGEIRIAGDLGARLNAQTNLIYDDMGLLIGPLRTHDSVHAIARFLLQEKRATPYFESWFDAADGSSLPRYFYELGGSFFLWLIESQGQALFLEFFRSKQSLRHFEGYYREDIGSLSDRWQAFLKEWK